MLTRGIRSYLESECSGIEAAWPIRGHQEIEFHESGTERGVKYLNRICQHAS